jgi:hypothetical protein
MHRRLIPLMPVLLATLLTACGGGGSEPQTSPLEAKWSQTQLVVGASLAMALHVTGTQVTGTGSYAVEAGRSGTLTVTGDANGGNVALTLKFDSGRTGLFSGSLTDTTHLDGRMSYDGSPASPVSFQRT